MAIAFVFWMAETAYFGWNLKPINRAEEICDYIAECLWAIGLIVMLVPGVTQYQKWMQPKNWITELR